MAWQETYETGRVINIAKAAEETAVPTTLPDTGSSLDWTATDSGENCYGWTVRDFKFTEDAFEIVEVDDDSIAVHPPEIENKVAKVRVGIGIDSVVFTSYEMGAKVLVWGTNTTDTSDVWTESATFTRLACIMEYEGLGLYYFPSVEIKVRPPAGGIKTLGTQEVLIDVFGTASVPTGYEWYQYQDA